jgi:hypothetical protein
MDWSQVSAIGGVVTLISGLGMGIIRLQIRDQLAAFSDKIRDELKANYLIKEMAESQALTVRTEMIRLNSKIIEIEDYAHTARHELANEIMNLKLQFVEVRHEYQNQNR